MAGGKKQQKKRKKKSWRAMLEGCFHRPSLGSSNKQDDSPEHQSVPEIPQADAPQPDAPACKPTQTLQDFEDKIALLQNSERYRLRGILKKSPSITSCSSPLYAEAGSEGPPGTSYSRPAFLSDGKTDYYHSQVEDPVERYVYDTRQLKTITNGHSDGQSAFTPYSSKIDAYGYSGGVVAGSYEKSKFVSGSRDKLHQSQQHQSSSSSKVFDPHYDTYNQTYEALKDRLYRRSHGQNRHSVDASHQYYSPRSFPPEDIYSKPHPRLSGVDHLEVPVSSSRQVPRGDETYVQLHEIQYRKQQQKNLNGRPLSAPPASWHGQCILSSGTESREAVDNKTFDYSGTSGNRSSRNAVALPDNQLVVPPSRYITSALPRSRDPIRKPMGSQYCPYPVQPNGAPEDACRTTARADDHDRVEISHIYATVTRSGNETTTSSYIYASISWKGGPQAGPHHPQSVAPPPPIPPRQWADPVASGCRGPAALHSRPPLPSYEQVIESRTRYGRGRPVSWSEFSHHKETERKREAFMQLLAQRYPQYADKIQGTGGAQTPPQQVERPARSREIQRRRTAVVTYDPHQAGHTLEYDDQGTMSDLELPSFQRGGFTRTSLPIVRSASTSLERPLGLVFLVYGDQTKKSLLPNEITTLDTVRALFVRAFPDLNLEMLENPRKKIYLLDPATNIYFQLEDLAEIKDRSVLKIHETDNDEPQRVREKQEVRGRTVQMPVSRSHSRGPFGDVPATALDVVKSHSLPPQVSHNYQELMQEQQNQWERRSRSRTPEPADRPRSLSAGSSSRQRFSHSPDRLPTPERAPLNPIPENRQLLPGYQDPGNYYEPVGPAAHRGPYPAPVYDVPASYQGYPPASPGISQQTYLTRSTRAPPLALPQRAIGPAPDPREAARLGNRQGLPYAPNTPNGTYQQRSQSFRIPASERDGTDLVRSHSVAPSDDTTSRNRIEKMEQQLASLTAWVHYQKADGVKAPVQRPSSASSLSDSSETFPISSASKHKGVRAPISTVATTTNHVVRSQGLSDIPDGYQGSSGISSRESTPLSAQAEVTVKLAQLKSDLHVLRRQQQLNMEAMKEEFLAVGNQIKKVLSSVPESENQLNFHNRNEVTLAKYSYNQEKEKVHKELSDLEASVEELRTDVLSRQCRVNSVDVEGMALLLSNVTKSLAELKARFPELQSQLKSVMDAEMRQVVSEEKFLKEEPTEIEGCLKRCKKLTNTLYTLKRLASVQDHRPSQVPQMPTATNAVDDDQKNALLENIRSLVPDHDQRVHQIEAAEAARERKKKISTQQEALKFGKTLELASKNLRPPSATGDRIQDSGQPVAEDQGSSKPAIAAKPVLAQVTTSMAVSLPYTTIASVANVASVKPSFSTAPSSSKPIEKPTATVSAMTSSVSDSVTTTAAKPTTETTSVPYMTKSAALTETSGRLSSISGGSDSLKKTEPSIYTYQVCGPVNPVIPFPPMFKPTSFESTDKNGTSSSEKVQTLAKSSEPVVEKSETKKLSVSFSESSPTFIPDEHSDPYKNTNCTDSEKTDPTSEKQSSIQSSQSVQKPVDLATQKQAARSAFFSSLNSPPTSPTMNSPSRNSASLDLGPVITPTGVVGKIGTGPTINLVLTGCASPKSPTSPGTFTISPPKEIFYPPVEMRRPSPKASPSRDLLKLNSESRSSGSDTSDSSQTDGKKKVPPPPPPRKGSRPTSASVVSPTFKSQDMPRFVGGVLGQHRLSGGPLSSTPKPIFAQRPLSKFEKDISSGLYANINKVEPPSQAGSVQQRLSEANVQKPESDNNNIYDASIPPPPSVTIPFDREERGSSSDSTSSSSGTSMGSQQSVVSVVQSASVNYRPVTKPKPDPPRRQSSLLSKFTGDKDDKLNNGNANLNGVDL
ncbi:serine/arginine repetitive matrix protein 2 [Biomphalaria glabrata]|nr:serine/arginine repetitive matrix protein 2 [Biomphalaria glabrata]